MDMINADVLKTNPWLQHYDGDVPLNIRYPSGPVTNLLYNAATYWANKAAIWFYGTEMTFGELYVKSAKMANSLTELDIQKGDRVGIQLPGSPQFCVAYWAILMTGGIVVNLNPTYTLDEMEFITKNTGLKGIITSDEMLPTIMKLNASVEIPVKIVTRITDFITSEPTRLVEEMGLKGGWYDFVQLIDKSRAASPYVTIESEDPAIIQFTGGTAGLLKGAILTHRNVMAASLGNTYWKRGIYNQFPLERRVALCTLPFAHVYGEIHCVNYSVSTFSTLVILPQFDVDKVFDVIASFDSFFYWPCMPTMLHAFINHPRFPYIGNKITHVSIGEAPLPLELAEQANKNHISVSQGWAMYESTAWGIGEPCLGLKKIGSVGIPNIDCEVKIVDIKTDNELPSGQSGEILLRGPFIMKGYWNNPEETAQQLLPDGWLRTGEIGYMDEEGYIFIVDQVNNK